LVQFFAVGRVDNNGFDMAPVLRQLSLGSAIYAQQRDNADNWVRWAVRGTVADNGTWFRVRVERVDFGGAGIGLNDDLAFRFASDSRQQETFDDPTSIAQWGLRHLNVDTIVATGTQASQLALLILARRAQPYWRMPGVLASYELASINEQAAFDSLEVSEGVTIAVDTAPAPTPGNLTEWTVEGWVEEWAEAGHTLQLALSDRARTGGTGLRSWAEMGNLVTYSYPTFGDPTDDPGEYNQTAVALRLNAIDGDGRDFDAAFQGRTNVPMRITSGGGTSEFVCPEIDMTGDGNQRVNGAGTDTIHTITGAVTIAETDGVGGQLNSWAYWSGRKWINALVKGINE